jgi:2-polyprenyl-3-methyl-5-hydroxy-6-metoxy-1,4-benzoquinol methylase
VFSVEDAAGNSRARERVDGLKKNQAASETRHTGVSALRASPIDRTADHWLTPAAIASRLCEPVRTNAKHKRFFYTSLSRVSLIFDLSESLITPIFNLTGCCVRALGGIIHAVSMRQPFPDFSRRSSEPEIMDGADYSPEEALGAYHDLRRVNKYLGGTSALMHHLWPIVRDVARRPVTIVDIGAGSADMAQAIARAARRDGIDVRIVALDLSQHAINAAKENTKGVAEISIVQAHAAHLPLAENSADFVVASEFLHHLSMEQAAGFLRRLHQISRVAFVINDLRRHPIPYVTFMILSHLFTQNRLIRNDGLISILRGFTPEDVRELKWRSGLSNLSAYDHFPYRIVMVGKK